MNKLSSIPLVVGSLFLLGGAAHAQEQMPVIQNLAESLKFLNTVKEQKLPADVIALQTALNRILDLWNAQNDAMMSDINAIEELVPEEYATRVETYRATLAEIRLWNDDVREKINQDISASEIIILASKLRARQKAREGALNEVIDFTSIFLNQNAITKINTRLAAVIKDEKKIKATLTTAKWTTMNNVIKHTQTLLKNAAQLNKKAVALLDAGAAFQEENKGLTIEGLVEKSGEAVKATYVNFLAMSKLIKK